MRENVKAMPNKKIAFLFVVGVLAGCSSAMPIQKVSESQSPFDDAVYKGDTIVVDSDSSGLEQYRVFSQGSTGFVPQSAVRSNAESRAEKFCKDQGKQLKILQERRSPSLQILGNFPRSELIFVCKDKSQESRTETPNMSQGSNYSKLSELKKMKDEGLITAKEYDIQKSKILNK